MEIPEKCANCLTAQGIAEEHVPGYAELITRHTGRTLRFGHRMPVNPPTAPVALSGSAFLGQGAAHRIWNAANKGQSSKEERLQAQCGPCPGLLEGYVEIGDTEVAVPVCGRAALAALVESPCEK